LRFARRFFSTSVENAPVSLSLAGPFLEAAEIRV
jgi:hypothetical protein